MDKHILWTKFVNTVMVMLTRPVSHTRSIQMYAHINLSILFNVTPLPFPWTTCIVIISWSSNPATFSINYMFEISLLENRIF